MNAMGRTRRIFSLKSLVTVVVALAILAALAVYLLFFTPDKRAVRQHLGEADTKSKAAIDARLKPLTELFAKARKGAKPFAEEALSWSGKWALLKGLADDGASHRLFLSEAFARHVFSSEELRAAMESAVRAYLDDVEGYESEMLVRLRADLANLAPEGETMPVMLNGDKEFRREYQKMSDRVVRELHAELGVTVGREIGMLVLTEIATQAALQAAKAAAAEMGVSAALLGSGAVSMATTLGVGLVISIILDALIDAIFKELGYDPAAKIEAIVCESIDKLEAALIRDPGFMLWEEKGSLRQQMEKLHEARSKLRRETINRLLKERGM
jgi:Ca2+/Na+ antiporter